jgi:hypothetical protein
VKNDFLTGSKELTCSQSIKNRVSNISCSTSDGNSFGWLVADFTSKSPLRCHKHLLLVRLRELK